MTDTGAAHRRRELAVADDGTTATSSGLAPINPATSARARPTRPCASAAGMVHGCSLRDSPAWPSISARLSIGDVDEQLK
jgi:hypothetical protein